MTRGALNSRQGRTLKIIEELGFGRIDGLSIRDGQPCYDRPFRIVESIKLDSEPERRADHDDADQAVKKEFERLFSQLNELRNGVVDIDVRHGVPFRLVIDRSHEVVP
jgi:hypothetical protein